MSQVYNAVVNAMEKQAAEEVSEEFGTPVYSEAPITEGGDGMPTGEWNPDEMGGVAVMPEAEATDVMEVMASYPGIFGLLEKLAADTDEQVDALLGLFTAMGPTEKVQLLEFANDLLQQSEDAGDIEVQAAIDDYVLEKMAEDEVRSTKGTKIKRGIGYGLGALGGAQAAYTPRNIAIGRQLGSAVPGAVSAGTAAAALLGSGYLLKKNPKENSKEKTAGISAPEVADDLQFDPNSLVAASELSEMHDFATTEDAAVLAQAAQLAQMHDTADSVQKAASAIVAELVKMAEDGDNVEPAANEVTNVPNNEVIDALRNGSPGEPPADYMQAGGAGSFGKEVPRESLISEAPTASGRNA